MQDLHFIHKVLEIRNENLLSFNLKSGLTQ